MFTISCRLIIFASIVFFCSCDKLKSPESRELAGGYRLKRVRGSNELALIIPHRSGGLIINEIGWREPWIMARGSGSKYWEVIDTAHAERKLVSDEDLKANSTLNSIQTMDAERAWNSLNPDTRIW
ncbi:MAG TPA: hypothetical protein VJ719_14735 [Chthoniobacterales bacterium]|nr:hypothetical protein [Chthoniobacterales bacterium]